MTNAWFVKLSNFTTLFVFIKILVHLTKGLSCWSDMFILIGLID
jgi:hypothetical protein